MTAIASSSSTAALHEALDQARQHRFTVTKRLQYSRRIAEQSKTTFKRLRTELRAADRMVDLAAYELVDLEKYEEAIEDEGGTSAQLGKIRERKQRIQQRIMAGIERYNRVLHTLELAHPDLPDSAAPPEPPEPPEPELPGAQQPPRR